jgi:hypothetical protein
LATTFLFARTLSLAFFRPPVMGACAPLWVGSSLREGPLCDKLHAPSAGMKG